jgi:hypothetical protein
LSDAPFSLHTVDAHVFRWTEQQQRDSFQLILEFWFFSVLIAVVQGAFARPVPEAANKLQFR